MSVSHSVKRFVVGRRHNSRGRLMSHTDVERADAAAADAAISLAAEALAVAVAVDNDGVENDDFNKTTFLMFVAYVHFLNLFQTVVDLYSRVENIFDDFYMLNIIQKIIWPLVLFFVFCFVCMRRCFHSFDFECIQKTNIHNCNSCVDMKYNYHSICSVFIS